ncbi:MAG: peptidylprolyl isomerase [Planctomycetota bacterium]|nr:peptidylprolyl isomerase [Planctomycetota bacterium]
MTHSSPRFRSLLRLLPVLLVTAFVLTACGDKEADPTLPNATVKDDGQPAGAADPTPGKTSKTPPQMPPQMPPAVSADTVIVTVNGEGITQGEVDTEIARMVLGGRPIPANQLPMVRGRFGQQAEKILVERKLLVAAVEKEKIEASAEELAERWKEIDARITAGGGTRDAALKQQGMTQEQADKEIALGIRLEKLLKKHTTVKPVTDEAAKEHYEKNVGRFKVPAEVRARHILLKFEPKMTDEEKAALEPKLAAIRAEAMKEGGKGFEELAKEHSGCPSGAQGGDLGFFGRGRMVPEFDKLAFDLEIGVVSEPFRTDFGYHIMEVREKREARTKPFEEVKEQLKAELSSGDRQRAQTDYIAKLREGATIERPTQK